MNNPNEEFDLFATEVEDNLQETLAKGSYKWTNKYTAVLAGLVVVTASVSGGIWYGNKHAASLVNNTLSGFASRISGAAAGGAFTGAAGPAGAGAFAGAGTTGGTSGFAGGGFGGSRLSGTISKVNGTTVTITLDAAPSTPIAAGDSVSVRDTGAAAATGGAPAGATAGGAATTGTKRTRGTAAAGGTATTGGAGTTSGATTSGTTTKPTIGGGAPGAGGNGGQGGGGGGRFNNPAFRDCLAKNGVTLTPGTRPDRTDPKVAAALQVCLSTLGGGAPGAGGGGFGGGNGGGARPAPSATP